MIIFVSDMAYMLIPDKVLLYFGVFFVITRLFIPLDPWWDAYLGAAIGFTLPLLIAIVSKGGMGGGDIKLFAVLGFVLGWQGILLAFLFSSFYGAFLGLIGMIFGKVKRGQPMAFGPYIVLGALTAYFFGEKIVNWYFTSFIA
ncbi:prepilin signal peptidase PulO-like enzyme (type II secretory pathway) [Evansella vedderi]|uniref:Prepilin signal peptidase PulO-like enzyme (Type II secretory pathway) n=2 Tax=Evansella vedderi TaxID=38282 RepID=A0ABU0A1C7_9BACI|nr:prepilin signal peptidase PulO-like enzyme (type II secretory pathway) [Evansella vedderi]